jgi:hypothetical protein
MSKTGDLYIQRVETARYGSDDAKIKEFGSVAAAADWLANEERMQEQADSVDPPEAA